MKKLSDLSLASLAEYAEFFEQRKKSLREGDTKVEYPEFLTEPIYVDPAKWGDDRITADGIQKLTTKQQLAYRAAIDALCVEKWNALLWLYGIPLSDPPAQAWEELARTLVTQHVSGFRVTNEPPATDEDKPVQPND